MFPFDDVIMCSRWLQSSSRDDHFASKLQSTYALIQSVNTAALFLNIKSQGVFFTCEILYHSSILQSNWKQNKIGDIKTKPTDRFVSNWYITKTISSVPMLFQILKIMKSLDTDGISRSYLQGSTHISCGGAQKYECNSENIAGTFANEKYV